MARLARVVIPGIPHHVTQRGNGRARTFFGDEDYALYSRPARGVLSRRGRGNLGLVPDAEPRSSHSRAVRRRRATARAGSGAMTA